ncbi:hypothetical protein D3C85_1559820 [compost metagenome]
MDRIGAFIGIFGHYIGGTVDCVGIIANPTNQRIIAQPAIQRIATGITINAVVAAQAVDQIITFSPAQHIIASSRDCSQLCLNSSGIPDRFIGQETNLLDTAAHRVITSDANLVRHSRNQQNQIIAILGDHHIRW